VCGIKVSVLLFSHLFSHSCVCWIFTTGIILTPHFHVGKHHQISPSRRIMLGLFSTLFYVAACSLAYERQAGVSELSRVAAAAMARDRATSSSNNNNNNSSKPT